MSELYDWRATWLAEHHGQHVALLVAIGGELPHQDEDSVYLSAQDELRSVLDVRSLATVQVDPYTGAGGYGLGAIWEIVGRGADLFAWVTAALVAARQIRTAAQLLGKKFGGAKPATVYLSGEAIKALCVAELCESGVDPRTIEAVNLVEHKYLPAERSIEKQQFYSAYTVTVSGQVENTFYHVWSFLVTCRGEVVSRGHTKIPVPNFSSWSDVDAVEDKLKGLP